MDETGAYILSGFLGVIAVIAGVWTWEWRRQRHHIQVAHSWPMTEATIQAGKLEAIQDSSVRSPIILPVFAFSYQFDGNYYSGRFSLSHLNTDANELIQRLTGQKLQVHCDPSSPDAWFIPQEYIEGCKVEQKMGPHVIALYPQG